MAERAPSGGPRGEPAAGEVRCPSCGARLPSEGDLKLHQGTVHPSRLA